jgi:hypothetical protein
MTTPDITRSDLSAGVEMGKLSDGYFSDPRIAQAFIDIALTSILPSLGDRVNTVGFGGGEGLLTEMVMDFIAASGRQVSSLVVDANPGFLVKASDRGLATLCADLSTVTLKGFHLVTMRSVNHYNSIPVQQRIVDDAYAALADGGFLVSQNLSGPSAGYCRLASQLSKFPSLGRVEEDQDAPHITSEEEFTALMEQAGFSDIRIAGYAPAIEVGPAWYWARFNDHRLEAALAAGDSAEVAAIDRRQGAYFREANAAISAFLETASKAEAAPIRQKDGNHTMDLSFPVFVGRRGEKGL